MIVIKKPHLKLILNDEELLSSVELPMLGSIDETVVVTYLYSNRFPELRGQFLLSRTSGRYFPSGTRLFYPDERKRFDFIFDLVESTECYTVELGKDWIEEVSGLLF